MRWVVGALVVVGLSAAGVAPAGAATTRYVLAIGSNEVPGEASLHLSGRERLTRQVLAARLIERTRARRIHLLLDACHAGDVAGTRGFFGEEVEARPAGPPVPEAVATLRERFAHLGILLSTSEGAAHEWSRVQAGLFSHEVRSGLRGAADINLDGGIEYSEIVAFVSAANLRIARPDGAPRVVILPPRAHQRAPLFAPGALQPALRADRLQGRLRLRSARGVRWLDAHLAGRPVRLIVPPGEALEVHTDQGVARLLRVEGELALEVWARGERAQRSRILKKNRPSRSLASYPVSQRMGRDSG